MQTALVEGEARFRSIFETSGAGIVIADYHGTIRYINRAYADMLGYAPDDMVGRSFVSLSPEGEIDPVVDYAEEMKSGARNNLSLEKKYRHRAGHVIWVRLNIDVVDGLGMGERMLVGVAQDITERRDLKEVIRDRFGVEYHERSVSRLLHDLGFSHMSARVRHPGQDAAMLETFKETSPGRSPRR